MIINSPFISGSTTITGNLTVSGSISGVISGSVDNAVSSSYALNATNATNATNAVSAQTASYADNFTVAGTLTSQKIIVQTVTSSVVYSSGSNVFGNSLSNTQSITGSLQVTGSSHYVLGNVGIGITSPTTNLHVNATGNDPVLISNTGASSYNSLILSNNNNNKVVIGIGGGSVGGNLQDNGYVGTISNRDFLLSTNNTERMRITSGGNVGIGTTSPSARLDVTIPSESPASGNVALVARTSNGANDIFRWFDGATQLGVFKNSGNVGIGTTSPSALLHVNGQGRFYSNSSSTPGLIVAGAGGVGTTNQGELRFGDAGNVYKIQGGQDYGAMNFITNNLPRLVITDVGNVGIGTTGPFAKLQVESNDYSIISYSTSAFSSSIYGENTDAGVGIEAIANSGTGLIVRSNTGNIASFFGASGGEKVTLKNNGNVLIGTTTDAGYKLDVNGTGRFSGTAGNGSSFFNFNTTSANSVFNWVSTAFASNLAVDNNLIHFIGQSGSTKNSAYLGFKYKGSGSNNNILTLGLYAVDNVLNINGLGNVGIGTESPSYLLHVSTSTNSYIFSAENTRNVSGDTNSLKILGNNCNNTSSYYLVCSMPSGDKMYIYGNGNIVNTNNSYGTLSDIRLKENIVYATPKLNDILNLKVRNFNLIGDENKQIGFIADEFEEIFPKMVEIDGKSGMKSIKTSVLVPMLVKAIQEQQAQIEELKALINK